MTKGDINTLINDVHQMGFSILRIQSLLKQIKDKKSYDYYHDQMANLFIEYDLLCGLLRYELEKYIKKEQEANLPIDLTYRKILRSLED